MFGSAPRLLLLAGVALAAAACSDHNPTSVGELPPVATPPEATPPPVHAAMQCRMDVRAESLTCAAAGPETAPGISALIVGGQGTHVKLASSGTTYNAATGILRSNVTVQNLMAQALGTDDGVFPSPEGVRVFFHAGPTVSGGTGAVSVANADGEAAYTAASQKYFQYAGLLAKDSTTAAREWRFNVPPTVATFVFTVYVAAPVRGATTPPAGIVFLAGDNQSDSVDAEPATALRIGVRGADGKPAASTYVRVAAMPLPYPAYGSEMLFKAAGSGGFTSSTYEFTNAQGILELKVKMGTRAGPARVFVEVLGGSVPLDTAHFTVRPGRASSVMTFLKEANALIGAHVPITVLAFDRYGNVRTGDPVTLTVESGPGTVVNNEVIAGPTIGRVKVMATVGVLSDTMNVNVAPPGTVAAYSTPSNSGQTAAIYTFSLDGSNLRRVRTTIVGGGYFGDMDVAWLSPTKLVYHDNNSNHTKQLYTLNLTTGAVARFLPLPDWMEMENYPKASRDGQWVYFSGGESYSGWSMYRARSNGSAKERMTFTLNGFETTGWSADLSPDGTRVVFTRDGEYSSGLLTVGQLSTREARALNLKGLYPRWSPDGSQIAFLATSDTYTYGGAGVPAVVNADGTDARALTITRFVGGIDWSPDGKYIVGAVDYNKLGIIEVATGNEVVIPYDGIDGTIRSPVWRPEPAAATSRSRRR